jgi:hypothetical protein
MATVGDDKTILYEIDADVARMVSLFFGFVNDNKLKPWELAICTSLCAAMFASSELPDNPQPLANDAVRQWFLMQRKLICRDQGAFALASFGADNPEHGLPTEAITYLEIARKLVVHDRQLFESEAH